LESSLLLYQLAKINSPDGYQKLLKLRLPWFVHLNPGDGFARLEVTNRINPDSDAVFGPFSSRGPAQLYEGEVSGLFQLRRCTDALEPDVNHSGCIYGEMGQCLRPCQCAVSGDEYGSETKRVHEFLKTNGRSVATSLSMSRARAAEETNFEEAALIHRRLEKIKAAAALRPPVVRGIADFNGLALTASASADEVVLWPVLAGLWVEPIRLNLRMREQEGRSLDRELRGLVEEKLRRPEKEAGERDNGRMEHLAIFARWYYSSWRDGEWFPFQTAADLNYRKLVREISKLASSTGDRGAT
jgi:hypothetical protein